MRGAITTNGELKTEYITVSQGEFVKRVKEKTQTSISRNILKGKNEGKEIHEERFSKFGGQLIKVDVDTEVYFEGQKPRWAFVFDVSPTPDEMIHWVLTIDYMNGNASDILKRLPNINIKEDIILTAYKFTPKGESKERRGISISQNGEKVFPYYTKDNKNGLPEMKKIKVNGEVVWDSSEKMEFLEEMVKKLYASETPEPESEEAPF